MNVQKIFQALRDDDQNSALGIICNELENQGYSVNIDNVSVTSEGFFNGEHGDIEKKIGTFTVLLMKNGENEQEFCVEFTDFHEFILKQKL